LKVIDDTCNCKLEPCYPISSKKKTILENFTFEVNVNFQQKCCKERASPVHYSPLFETHKTDNPVKYRARSKKALTKCQLGGCPFQDSSNTFLDREQQQQSVHLVKGSELPPTCNAPLERSNPGRRRRRRERGIKQILQLWSPAVWQIYFFVFKSLDST
jgi:hypothetical protein